MESARAEEIDRYLIQLLNNPNQCLAADSVSAGQWQHIYRRAERHGIAPLVYWQLRREPTVIPASIFEQFKQAYLTTLGRNRIFLAELDRVVRLLNAQGIDVVLLKGAVFVRTLYEDIGFRPMSDLDILLRKEDIPQAVSLLKKNGYHEPVLHQSELLKQDVTHDVHLRQTQAPHVDIEVHWLLVGGERFRQKTDMDWFWNRITALQGYPNGVYTLTPTAHLLYLCGHLGFQHGLGSIGLLWLIEIVRFLEKYGDEIDWGDFVAGAKHHLWSAAAYYTFQEVNEHFQLSIPDAVLEQLRFHMTAAEEEHVLSMRVVAPSRVVFAWKQFQQLDNAARMQNIIGRIFPSLAFMRERYGFRSDWQAIVGYPIRWFDLTSVLLKYIWARLRGKRR